MTTRALRRSLALVAAIGLVAGLAPDASATTARAAPRYQYGINTYVTYNCQGKTYESDWVFRRPG